MIKAWRNIVSKAAKRLRRNPGNDGWCEQCGRDHGAVMAQQLNDNLLPLGTCSGCNEVLYQAPDPNHAEVGEFGYVLTDLCFHRQWEAALQRIQVYPKEAQLAPLMDEGDSALYWACYHSAPLELIKLLGEADPEQIGYPCLWSDYRRNPLQLLLYYRMDEDSVDTIKNLVCLDRESILHRDQGGSDALDIAWGYRYLHARVQESLQQTDNRLHVEDFDSKFKCLWNFFCFLYRAAYFQELDKENESHLIVHALTGLEMYPNGCPQDALQLAVRLYPEQLLEEDHNGDLPLHLVIKAQRPEDPQKLEFEEYGFDYYDDDEPYKDEHMAILITACPEAAKVPNVDRALPLHLAASAGKHWCAGGVSSLLNAYPAAIEITYRGWFPFVIAAMACHKTAQEDLNEAKMRATEMRDAYLYYHCTDTDSDDEDLPEDLESTEDWEGWNDPSFDSTYELLRAFPEAVRLQQMEKFNKD